MRSGQLGRQVELAIKVDAALAHIAADHVMLRALWELHQPFAPWSAWCRCGQRDPCPSRLILNGQAR